MTEERPRVDEAKVREVEARAEAFRERFRRLADEIGKVIVGHREVVGQVITAVLCRGHVLLEGVPGLGKTLLVRTLADSLRLDFSRIQFTPDLMPADITGTNIVVEDERGQRSFRFQKGPIFGNVILADEINRATPKTQSAVLEGMQERSVTVAGVRHDLPQPFFVLATQNPIEMEGTYPLPEAQLDRFLFKIEVGSPGVEDLVAILDRTTGGETPTVEPVLSADEVLDMQSVAREIPIAPHIAEYAARLVAAAHPGSPHAVEVTEKFIRYGPSPRGAQAMTLAAKVTALMDGRYHVSRDDIRKTAIPALRHRLILNFEAEAEGVRADAVVRELLDRVPQSPPRVEKLLEQTS